MGALLNNYAADYRKKSLTDEGAKKLVDEAVAIDEAEVKLKSSIVAKRSFHTVFDVNDKLHGT